VQDRRQRDASPWGEALPRPLLQLAPAPLLDVEPLVGAPQHLAQVLVDQRREHHRLRAAVGRLGLDAREAILGLLHAVDEG